MTLDHELRAQGRPGGWIWLVASFALVVLVLALTPGATDFGALGRARLHAPDFAPLMKKSWLVQAHFVTVMAGLALGPVQFVLPKGTPTHRAIGWVWVVAMLLTAIMSLFIRDMAGGAFSPIHVFSLMVLVGTPYAIWQARRGNVAAHARAMIGLYLGTVIAGITAIAPGRLIWSMFFG